MRQLTSNEIKVEELKLLIKFDKLCKKYNLRYSLAGGTLLGAVRHQGFISWDDDIDICMPRNDYMKLQTIFKNIDKQFKLASDILGNIDEPFSKIINEKFVVISDNNNSELDKYLWIDIFPVDGLPDNKKICERIYFKCDIYRSTLYLIDSKLKCQKLNFKSFAKYFLKPLAKLYGKKRCVKELEKIALSNPYVTSKYVGAVTWGLYGAGERMLKSEFEKTVEVEFEGHKFPAFSCWDSYLRGLYGNYMELPPIEKRKTHNMTVYLKED